MSGASSMTAEGLIELRLDLGNAAYFANAEVKKVLGAYAQKIRSDAINSMRRGTKTGRKSSVRLKGRKKGFSHTASAPGEPPAVITGRLMNSITAEAIGSGLTFEVGPTVNYGRYLEQGTKNKDGSTKMDARPFMGPALEANIPGLENALASAIQRALRG